MSICIKTPVKKLETPTELPSESDYLYNYNAPSLFQKTMKTIKNLKKTNVWPNISKKSHCYFHKDLSGRNSKGIPELTAETTKDEDHSFADGFTLQEFRSS